MILSRRAQMLAPRGRAISLVSDRDEAEEIAADLEAEESGAAAAEPCPFDALGAMLRAERRWAQPWGDPNAPGIEDDGNGWYTVTGGPHGPFQRYGWAAAADALSAILAERDGGEP